jgi:transcription initiation factor IIF auxiliary subunit
MSIRVEQAATRRGQDSWDWSVWLEGSDEALDQVETAEYVLHPTFPNPVREMSNRANNFRLNAHGWGEFMIHVNIHLKDGETVKYDHWLKLRDDTYQAPTKEADFSFDLSATQRRVYLSCSLADIELAKRIDEVLGQYNFKMLMSDAFDPNLTLERAISLEREPIDGAIFLITDFWSPYLPQEAQVMRDNSIPILPILVGPEAKLPREFADLVPIHVKDRGESEAIAMSIVEQLKI